MNMESLEYRVDDLEYQRLQITKEIKLLEQKKERIRGKLEEVWAMIDGYKEKNEYGYSTLEGDVRVLKLPTIGSDLGIEEALQGELRAGEGESLKEVKAFRLQKHKDDAQMAVNVMDGMSPETDEDDWKLGRE